MINTCKTHQFINVREIRKQGTTGAAVVCAICGEVRNIYEDGTVNIIIPGDIGKLINDAYAKVSKKGGSL